MRGFLRERRTTRRGERRAVLAVLECLESRQLLSTFTVTSLEDSGPGSFRQAILNANANPGLDQIAFDTKGATFPVFSPLTPLPDVLDPVVIDGSTEPGFVDRPVVTLDGSKLTTGGNGLEILAGQSTIKSLVITGFPNYGVVLTQNGGNVLQGNYIGVDATGGTAAPNQSGGVIILGSQNNSIGVPVANGGNVISGNGGTGLTIAGPTPSLTQSVASGNQIRANYLGVDSTGTKTVPNQGHGIQLIHASANAIGGTGVGEGNLISGNAGSGISIDGDPSGTPSSSTGGFNRIQGNLIGTSRDGTLPLGNRQFGVLATASANSIGGTVAGAANVIAYNGADGVAIVGQNIPILANQIFGNAGVGINLAGNLANHQQADPTILSVNQTGNSAVVTASLVGAPLTTYTVEFFANLAGESQARIFVGTSFQTTDATGRVTFAVTIPSGVPIQGTITATSTSPDGNTSELSSIAPVVDTVQSVSLAPNRSRLTVTFASPVEASSARNAANYRISVGGKPIVIKSIGLSADGLSVVITLKKAVPSGKFAQVSINPLGSPGVKDLAGVLIDGDQNGLPGGTSVGLVGVGSTLKYQDATGSQVTLQVAKGGTLEIYRDADGNAEVVQLHLVKRGKTVLSGSVKGATASTTIPVLTGLNGAINKLTNPPFVIGKIV